MVKENQRAFLRSCGFTLRGSCSKGTKSLTMKISGISESNPGAYAFVVNQQIFYIGSSQRGLRERLGHYEKTQGPRYTSARVRSKVLKILKKEQKVEVFTYTPKRIEIFRGKLPVDLVAGIEMALIRKYSPPWNKKGHGKALTVESHVVALRPSP